MVFYLDPANIAASYVNQGDFNKFITFLKDHTDPEKYIITRFQFMYYKGRRQEFVLEVLWEKQ